jgi:hypothetical protein
MHDDEEYKHQHPDVLPLKPTIKEIHDYILRNTHYTGDSYIIERINDDRMPVRIIIDNTELAKYNTCLINSIELHQAKSTKLFNNDGPTYSHNIYRILSVKCRSSDKSIDLSSDNILLTANEMYADKTEIQEYKAKDLALPAAKKTKSRTSSKKEEKQERIIAILVNLLARESVKAKSNHYIKGEGNINTLAISGRIIELADEYEINKSLTNDTSLATEINRILDQHSNLNLNLRNI